MRIFGRKRRDERYLADEQTMFGRTRIYDVAAEGAGRMRVLDVEGTWQSACYLGSRADELAFRYHRSFAEVLEAHGRPPGHALMLGGGGFAFPAWLLAHHPDVQVEVIEIDPSIVALARRWLSLATLTQEEESRLRIVVADATDELRRRAAKACRPSHDLIVNDLFAAERPERALMDARGLAVVRSLLAPGGLYLANVVSALRGARSRPLQQVREALDATFAHVLVLPLGADEPRVADNNVVIASDAELAWLA